MPFLSTQSSVAPIIFEDDRRSSDMRMRCERFLKAWSGNWNAPTIRFHNPDGLWTPEVAEKELFASAMNIDFLQQSDTEHPCPDDWGTRGKASGRKCLGILVHDSYRRVAEHAFSTVVQHVAITQ